jgi:hypothetical protein
MPTSLGWVPLLSITFILLFTSQTVTVYDPRRALRVHSDLCAACELHFQQRGEIAGIGKVQPGVPRIIHENSVNELHRMVKTPEMV